MGIEGLKLTSYPKYSLKPPNYEIEFPKISKSLFFTDSKMK